MVPDTHLQKSHGYMGGEKWSQELSKVDTYPPIQSIDHGPYRRSIRIYPVENTCRIRSISTVDDDSPTENYGRWTIKNRDNFVVDFIHYT